MRCTLGPIARQVRLELPADQLHVLDRADLEPLEVGEQRVAARVVADPLRQAEAQKVLLGSSTTGLRKIRSSIGFGSAMIGLKPMWPRMSRSMSTPGATSVSSMPVGVRRNTQRSVT